MKAVLYHRYGAPDVLRLEETDMPAVPDDGVRVRVRAAALNAIDVYFLTGQPPFIRLMAGPFGPRRKLLGTDFAGTVESVGSRVTRLRAGDEVYGATRGTLAEFVCAAEWRMALKPANLTFEQAAAVPLAGITALQGLRDRAQVRPGQRVLINGASGGVGTFAVQIARALGAEVTAVCSTKHVERARSLGADKVIDSTREDFTRGEQGYDVLFDIAGNHAWSEYRRVLKPRAICVVVGRPRGKGAIGPLGSLVQMLLASAFDSRRIGLFMARMKPEDLAALAALIEAGRVTPVIDRRYELVEAAEGFRHQLDGHPSGKVVIAL